VEILNKSNCSHNGADILKVMQGKSGKRSKQPDKYTIILKSIKRHINCIYSQAYENTRALSSLLKQVSAGKKEIYK